MAKTYHRITINNVPQQLSPRLCKAPTDQQDGTLTDEQTAQRVLSAIGLYLPQQTAVKVEAVRKD